MNKKMHFFNMIEVLLALTVIAVGMTSVLGLFPVGLNASREAIAQNCSADVADQMVTYMRVMGESSSDAYTYTFTDTNNNLPTLSGLDIKDSTNFEENITIDIDCTGGDDVEVETLSNSFLTAYKTDKVGIANVSNINGYIFQRVAPGWAIFTVMPNPTTQRRRVYFIVQGPDCTEDGGNRNIDYSAMALVWKEPMQIRRLKSGGDASDSNDWELWPPDTDIYSDAPTNTVLASTAFAKSAKINVELSWPLELPYKERKKRYYQIVINKPDA